MRLQIEFLERNVEQLRRERDDAIREAARFEGQIATLQVQFNESKAALSRHQRSKSRDTAK